MGAYQVPQKPLHQKGEKAKPTALRPAARMQTCALRLDCCNHNPETVVLAHLRFFGAAGIAQKPHDILGVFACSACHDAIDGRGNSELWGWDDILRALGETLLRHVESGRITINGTAEKRG